MPKDLFILRHAKSDWNQPGKSDFERPLNPRGEKDALKIAHWLQQYTCKPAYILSSPALRARQTVLAVAQAIDYDEAQIQFERELYLASLETLLDILQVTASYADSVMLAGHNPGLEQLALYLSRDELPRTDSGKLLTTANLLHFQFAQDWSAQAHSAGLISQIRPKQIT